MSEKLPGLEVYGRAAPTWSPPEWIVPGEYRSVTMPSERERLIDEATRATFARTKKERTIYAAVNYGPSHGDVLEIRRRFTRLVRERGARRLAL